MLSLAERIKEQRKKCGMSQEKVAELVGVSRQAVTKWETGQSAPSTENLFKLAEIFGITVDILLASEQPAKWKKNIKMAYLIAGGYIVIYLLGRVLCTKADDYTVTGWLFGYVPGQHTYLYGWLLHQNLFWLAMAISTVTALLGKHRFAVTTLSGFGTGLLLGELLDTSYYHEEARSYMNQDWALWAGIFFFSMIMGIILEKIPKQEITFLSKKFRIWSIACLIEVIAILMMIYVNVYQYGR